MRQITNDDKTALEAIVDRCPMQTHFYIVDACRGNAIRGQWVILATSEDEACAIAERRQAGIADFDTFSAELDADGLFDSEENLTEELPACGAGCPDGLCNCYCADCERSYGSGGCPEGCDCPCHEDDGHTRDTFVP